MKQSKSNQCSKMAKFSVDREEEESEEGPSSPKHKKQRRLDGEEERTAGKRSNSTKDDHDLAGPDREGSISVTLIDPEVLDCSICMEPLSPPVFQVGMLSSLLWDLLSNNHFPTGEKTMVGSPDIRCGKNHREWNPGWGLKCHIEKDKESNKVVVDLDAGAFHGWDAAIVCSIGGPQKDDWVERRAVVLIHRTGSSDILDGGRKGARVSAERGSEEDKNATLSHAHMRIFKKGVGGLINVGPNQEGLEGEEWQAGLDSNEFNGSQIGLELQTIASNENSDLSDDPFGLYPLIAKSNENPLNRINKVLSSASLGENGESQEKIEVGDMAISSLL
ncbi:hypothetical protein HHK36_014895 [Tetracentron sinense]|uniref:Uncharacterized protein n=1 Tax=Tetracentron sinense TaxID=13715 RepID=A0A834Z110_TETSI|nr:hypothetical protein HHK36_014895 [Tetracentron sinense]